jgi:hypothetical protein
MRHRDVNLHGNAAYGDGLLPSAGWLTIHNCGQDAVQIRYEITRGRAPNMLCERELSVSGSTLYMINSVSPSTPGGKLVCKIVDPELVGEQIKAFVHIEDGAEINIVRPINFALPAPASDLKNEPERVHASVPAEDKSISFSSSSESPRAGDLRDSLAPSPPFSLPRRSALELSRSMHYAAEH